MAAYLARLQQEVLPWVSRQFGGSLDPADLALAGSSLGGVAALSAGLSGSGASSAHQQGCGFGALLVESPSMWIANEGFLKVRVRGMWRGFRQGLGRTSMEKRSGIKEPHILLHCCYLRAAPA